MVHRCGEMFSIDRCADNVPGRTTGVWQFRSEPVAQVVAPQLSVRGRCRLSIATRPRVHSPLEGLSVAVRPPFNASK